MRVIIVEDDVLLREGLALLLAAEGIEVAAAVGDAETFLTLLEDMRPDAVVLDLRLPPAFRLEGLRAALRARRIHPGLPVLLLSSHIDEGCAAQLLADGGGVGYLLKERVGEIGEFLQALRRVADGGTVMDREVVARLTRRRLGHDPLRGLTVREREVLSMMAEGHSNRAIATLCQVTEAAVGKHARSIFLKLGLRSEDLGHRRVLAVLIHRSAGSS